MYTKKQVLLTVNNLWSNLWVRYGFYASIILVIAYYLKPANTNSSYLFSSISMILATIFAILFSIIVLLSQVIKKEYQAMDMLIHSKVFLFVFYFFFMSIMIPLFAIKTDYNILEPFAIENSIVANFTQSLCIASLAYAFLILIPFSKEVFQILKYNRVETLHYMKTDERSENDMEEIIRELLYLGKDFVDTNYEYNRTFIIPLSTYAFECR
jgi:hypothetical protein